MSYQRMGHVLKYVDGKSKDYVYCGGYKKGRKTIYYIQDYGGISDSGFIEMLFQWWKTDEKLFKEHFIKRLAKRLNVKLRKKPLTDKQEMGLDMKELKKFNKKNKKWLDKLGGKGKT